MASKDPPPPPPPPNAAAVAAGIATPVQGYYAVRHGKGGLRDCIFVSWERVKAYVDVGKDCRDAVEFCFFSKVEDAIQYIHPMRQHPPTNGNKSYADICTGTSTASLPESPSRSKRKHLGQEGNSLKKIRTEDGAKVVTADSSEASDKAGSLPGEQKNEAVSTQSTNGNNSGDEKKSDSGTKQNRCQASGASSSNSNSETIEEALASLNSSAPLNILLEQGFKHNLPKGWRSQHTGLFLTRRDYFREPALKQYLQDLNDLQNYREANSCPARTENGATRHFSGASHPLSVFYLNWAWGVCNSYHRDIRRQQKNRICNSRSNTPAPTKLYHPAPEGVPHFKPHPVTLNNRIDKHKRFRQRYEQAYIGFRHRGWRARDVTDPNLKAKRYKKDLRELEWFREDCPEELERYQEQDNNNNNPGAASKHPSGLTSPFTLEYVRWSFGWTDEELQALTMDHTGNFNAGNTSAGDSDSSEVVAAEAVPIKPKPSRRVLPTHPAGQRTAAVPDEVKSSKPKRPFPGEKDNEDTPELIASLKKAWFSGQEKGWRAEQMGFPQPQKSPLEPAKPPKLNAQTRKERERLYTVDLETLKLWWKQYPSSQHYIFPLPDVYEATEGNEADDKSGDPEATTDKNGVRRHKSGINAPWSLTYLNWSWGVSNSYNRDLVRKQKRKRLQQEKANAIKLDLIEEQRFRKKESVAEEIAVEESSESSTADDVVEVVAAVEEETEETPAEEEPEEAPVEEEPEEVPSAAEEPEEAPSAPSAAEEPEDVPSVAEESEDTPSAAVAATKAPKPEQPKQSAALYI